MEPATEQTNNARASGLAILRLTVPTPCRSFSAASVITALVLYSHDRYLKHPIIPSIYSITDFPHGGSGLPFLLLYLQDLDLLLAWSRAPNKY